MATSTVLKMIGQLPLVDVPAEEEEEEEDGIGWVDPEEEEDGGMEVELMDVVWICTLVTVNMKIMIVLSLIWNVKQYVNPAVHCTGTL